MMTYNLEELLPEDNPLPYFKPGDVIRFPMEHTLQPEAQALQLSYLLFQDVYQDLIERDPIYENTKDDPSDVRLMKERLFGKDLITGLSLVEYIFASKGDHPLMTGTKSNSSYGWLGELTISQSLPGIIESVSAEFDYIATIFRPSRVSKNGEHTLMKPVFRTGPYDTSSSKIGAISNPKLKEFRKRSRNVGPGSMAVGTDKTTPRHAGVEDD